MFYDRLLNINLPKQQSAFLWGARKTGKSTFLKSHFPHSIKYDLLKTDLLLKLTKSPHILREEILNLDEKDLKYPIIIDEVQKIPQLMNEIHWLMENKKVSFILCGSSARKLRSQSVNLLGGRAWRYEFYPLCTREIPEFSSVDLLHAFNAGMIPSHFIIKNSAHYKKSLKSYIQDYLTFEIQAEGLIRNLPAFSRFLDALSLTHGELTNFTNLSRDCGVDAKTIKEYYQILVDTLLGYFILPFKKSVSRQIIQSTPKFYLFDVGVSNFLAHREITQLKGAEAGKSLEHFILMELISYRGLKEKDFPINYWRTKSGLEVDFVLGYDAQVIIEVKISPNIEPDFIKGLKAFNDEHSPQKLILISTIERGRTILVSPDCEIKVMPWKRFLEDLWDGKII
jgi:predicted AAA+ superfamily ATPase